MSLLSFLLACVSRTPSWPADAAIQVVLPEEAAEDGSYTATLVLPTALGDQQRDFDLYQLSFEHRDPTETVELQGPEERPASRRQGIVLKGDETVTLIAASYGLKRPGAPLVVQITAPPTRAPGAAPKATAQSSDPLGRSDHFPLPVALSPKARADLNAALKLPLSLRDYSGSILLAEAEADALLAGALSLALQPCLQQLPVTQPTPATLYFQRAEGMTPLYSAKGLGPELSACLEQTMAAYEGGQGLMLTLEMLAQPPV